MSLAAAAHRQGFTAGVFALPDASADWGDMAPHYQRGRQDGERLRDSDRLPRWPGL